MKKIILSILFALLPFTMFAEATYEFQQVKNPQTRKVVLGNMWDCYWGEFIDPKAPYKEADFVAEVYHSWNEYNIPEEKRDKSLKSGQGAASFRLKVTNLKPNTQYSFNTWGLGYTAFTMFANGEEIFKSGEPNVDAKKTKMKQYMDIASFTSDDKGEAVLVMWCSNKGYRKGGFIEAVKLQEARYFSAIFYKELAVYTIVNGILLTIIIYSLLLGLLKKDKAYLWLSLFVFTFYARVAYSIYPIVNYFLPGISLSFDIRMEFLSVIVCPMAFVMYVEALDPTIYKQLKGIYFAIPGLILFALDCFLPMYPLSRLVPFMQAYTIINAIVIIFFVTLSVIQKRDIVGIGIISSLGIVIVGVLFEIFFINEISNSMISVLTPIFVIFSIVLSSLTQILSNRNVISANELNKQLIVSNKAAVKFVPTAFFRTFSKADLRAIKPGKCSTKKIAVMSIDIRNFTSIAERINEVYMFEILNTYLSRVTPIITQYNGVIEKHLGDGIVAMFPESSGNALQCAIKIQEEMINLRKEFKEKEFPEVRLGIGISYGNVTVGAVGDDTDMSELSISNEITNAMNAQNATKKYKRCIIVTKAAIAQAAAEAKKKNLKYDFIAKKIDNADEADYYCIYSEKIGFAL